jgi:3-oxoacyl-[acyl-carrier-protein] synthase-1
MVATNVVGVGAVSPFGFDVRQTTFGIRANKVAPRPSELRDRHGHRFGTLRALGFAEDVYGAERAVALAARALREAARDAGIGEEEPLRVFLSVAERERPLPESEKDALAAVKLLPRVQAASGQRIDGAASEVLRLGHAGFAVALERAIAALGSGGPIAVGGVDTYHHPDTMTWLDRERRVLSELTHNGFVPSEAAAFVIIAPSKGDKPVHARFTFVTAGVEQLPPDEPRIATLMTELLRRGAESMGSKHVPWVLTDLNHERHRTKEWTFATVRNHDRVVSGETLEQHLGQLAGDVGAAAGALAATYAITAFRTGFARHREALIALASDGDERGVLVVEATS